AILAGLLGLLLGVVLSRSLTAPLRRLAEAAHAVANLLVQMASNPSFSIIFEYIFILHNGSLGGNSIENFMLNL
ncbi:MAG: hypothetical protein QXO75_10860, partial [Nitrososphaerota archaeon]